MKKDQLVRLETWGNEKAAQSSWEPLGFGGASLAQVNQSRLADGLTAANIIAHHESERPDSDAAPLQAKEAVGQGGSAAPRASASGSRLPESVLNKMENAFGTDFSGVRISEGPEAASIGALAFTQGNDIQFAPHQYDPSSQSGQKLLGHELAHVVQQREGRVRPTIQAKGVAINNDPALEAEADRLGAQAASGERVDRSSVPLSPALDRGATRQHQVAGRKSPSLERQMAAVDPLRGGSFALTQAVHMKAGSGDAVQLKTDDAKAGDQIRRVADGQQFTVLTTKGGLVTVKGRLAETPFDIDASDAAYETVKEVPAPATKTPPAPPPPGEFLKRIPVEKRTKWEILKDERGLTDSEVAALQAYTTSTYAWINGYLRSGDGLGDDVKNQIVKWLVNTAVIGQIQQAEPTVDRYVVSLTKVEETKGAALDQKWQAAKPILDVIIALIVSAMDKWPQPGEKEVTRGVGLATVPAFVKAMHKPGQIATDPGFMSTTFKTPFSKDSIIVIDLPANHPGRNIAEVSKFEQEAEILFPPGTGYKVERILQRGAASDQVEFEHILQVLVPDAEERARRFNVVEKVYITTLTKPPNLKRWTDILDAL